MASEPSRDNASNFVNDLFQTRYREVTASAVLFGVIVGAIMNMAITYAGLKIGFTIGGSAIAAVLGFGVLRGILRRGSILETNISQTIASSINIPCSGIIFTVPVLFLLGIELSRSQFWLFTLAGVVGAVLGVAFIIPLRKQMIDIDRLRFPSALAVAAILKSPGAGPKKSLVLLLGALVAVIVFLPAALPGITTKAPLDELDDLVRREKISPAQAQRTRDIARWIEERKLPDELVERGSKLQQRINAGELKRGKLADADVLAITAYRITKGELDWSALESFSAKKPLLFGYSDLNWRLEADGETLTRRVDRDGNGQPDLILHDTEIDVGRWLGLPDYMLFVFAITPLSFGAGYLTGRAGLMVLAGGVLAFFVLNPVAYSAGWLPATTLPDEAPIAGYKLFNRPLGIGMLLGGALMGVVASLPAIREALKSISRAGQAKESADELGFNVLVSAFVLSVILLFVASFLVSGTAREEGLLGNMNPVLRNMLIALISAAWIWFAGIIIAQCTGMTDWSPISGMALITIVLILLLAGPSDVLGAVLIGVALCVAITSASDMMQDLKTGYVVGAQPKRQQLVELVSVVLGPIVAMSALWLIVEVNMRSVGKPIGPGTPTPAPQAQALEAVITGVQGGQMPYMLYTLGAVLGVLLGLGAFPGLGVLVGLSMYLPIDYILPYGLGCLANMFVAKIKGRAWAEEWGVPFCAGLIVGEAILAMVINLIILAVS
ncbi:MAG: hypothetical protein KatS3mg105_4128 [Gemmatales bacterium]|nr:MAG: hypothetical protein KatS3mg105_4128 [Gemmatales bacterium]